MWAHFDRQLSGLHTDAKSACFLFKISFGACSTTKHATAQPAHTLTNELIQDLGCYFEKSKEWVPPKTTKNSQKWRACMYVCCTRQNSMLLDFNLLLSKWLFSNWSLKAIIGLAVWRILRLKKLIYKLLLCDLWSPSKQRFS